MSTQPAPNTPDQNPAPAPATPEVTPAAEQVTTPATPAPAATQRMSIDEYTAKVKELSAAFVEASVFDPDKALEIQKALQRLVSTHKTDLKKEVEERFADLIQSCKDAGNELGAQMDTWRVNEGGKAFYLTIRVGYTEVPGRVDTTNGAFFNWAETSEKVTRTRTTHAITGNLHVLKGTSDTVAGHFDNATRAAEYLQKQGVEVKLSATSEKGITYKIPAPQAIKTAKGPDGTRYAWVPDDTQGGTVPVAAA